MQHKYDLYLEKGDYHYEFLINPTCKEIAISRRKNPIKNNYILSSYFRILKYSFIPLILNLLVYKHFELQIIPYFNIPIINTPEGLVSLITIFILSLDVFRDNFIKSVYYVSESVIFSITTYISYSQWSMFLSKSLNGEYMDTNKQIIFDLVMFMVIFLFSVWQVRLTMIYTHWDNKYTKDYDWIRCSTEVEFEEVL